MSELLSALIGALFGFFASLLTLRFYYRQLFAETVSKNRMDWINVWRENLAEFLSVATVLHAGCQNSSCSNQNGQCNLCDLKKEMMKAQIMITSRLNLTEESHCLILAAIKNFNYSSNNQNFTAHCEYIEELAREILKPDWERVKEEARGKIN